jgi:hypothetical protein
VRWFSLLLCVVGAFAGARAQIYTLNGGASTLYQAQGGSFSIRSPRLDAMVGAGMLDGHFYDGARLIRPFGRYKLAAGDNVMHFELPTDVFGTGAYFYTRGISLERALKRGAMSVFAGETAESYQTPLFEASKGDHAAGAFFFHDRLTPHINFISDTIVSTKSTSIQSIDWSPREKTDFALSAGMGANQPYAAASVSVKRPIYDVMASYIQAGSQFRRIAVEQPLTAEPDRGNIVVNLRPTRFLSFSGGRQDYLMPEDESLNAQETRSTVNSLSANLNVFKTSLSASWFESEYEQNQNVSEAFTASRAITRRIHFMGDYLVSHEKDQPSFSSLIGDFEETLSPRWTVGEIVTHADGQTSVSFGGSFLSNFLEASANYQTYYIPALGNKPFEQALIVDLQVHLMQGLTLHAGSFVSPDGKLEYTADFTKIMSRDPASKGTVQNVSLDNSMIEGHVVDTSGNPVPGAALQLDKMTVYADQAGHFFVREHTPHTHQFSVLTDQFLDGGNYSLVSAPPTVRGARGEAGDEITVVVRRSGNVAAATPDQPQPQQPAITTPVSPTTGGGGGGSEREREREREE